jgi:hypothetical protein
LGQIDPYPFEKSGECSQKIVWLKLTGVWQAGDYPLNPRVEYFLQQSRFFADAVLLSFSNERL